MSSPLRLPAFRALWVAATISFLGTFVQDVGERWLILDLTRSPLASGGLAAAFMVASLVAILPAGVLADRMDRRRLVLASQVAQGLVAAVIGVLALTGRVTPALLSAGAAGAGLGMAIGSPAWSAILSNIVPKDQVAEAVTLNAVSFNLARAIGPAIGGVILELAGASTTFLVNAATFVAVIAAVLLRLQPAAPSGTDVVPQPMRHAFAEPFGHVLRDRTLRATFFVMVLFTGGAAFVYTMAAPFAKLTLAAGPSAYGFVIGALGLGAVCGAIALKRFRERFTPRRLLAILMAVYGIASIALSQVDGIEGAVAVSLVAGVGWTGTFASMTALVQIWTPDRLRARSLALYHMIHLGMWAVGATAGGAIAEHWTIRGAILAGGVICTLSGAVAARLPLPPSFAP